jgi:hypothetical protein
MNNREKYIELFLNEVAKVGTDYQKAKKCYAIAGKMILEELDTQFQGFACSDREQFWINEVKKYEND